MSVIANQPGEINTNQQEAIDALLARPAFDQDLRRPYPQIDADAQNVRQHRVNAALQHYPNRFALCRKVVQVTRIVHDFNSDRIPETINKSLGMLARAGNKPTMAELTKARTVAA